MPNVFDDEETGPNDAEFAAVGDEEDDVVEEEFEATDAQVEASLESELASTDSFEALDLECEERFEVASCYRELLKGRFFQNATKASNIVEAEARAFFKERLEVLIGIRAPKADAVRVESPFSAEEVEALKAVAKRIVAKPELVAAKPTLRQVPAPAARPTTRVAPIAQQQAKPVTPVKAKPAAKPAVVPKAVRKPVAALKENGVIADTGKIVQKGHKVYRVVTNDLGTEFKQDITGQGNPTNRVPMPSGPMLEQVTAMQSANQISKLDIQIKGSSGIHHIGVQDLANKVS